MATGLPVVGSRVGGINQNVEHGNTGFLYEPNNVDEFATALEQLASDPELRQQFGERAREMIAESFTKETLKREFEKAISK
jgi:glycosyltransferase involved in cell wall biosynthesis